MLAADGEPKRVMKQSQQSSLQSKNQGTSSTTKQGQTGISAVFVEGILCYDASLSC